MKTSDLTLSAKTRDALRLKKQERYANPPLPGATPPRDYTPTGTYTAPELRPFTGRAGAMDAYDIPSLGLGA